MCCSRLATPPPQDGFWVLLSAPLCLTVWPAWHLCSPRCLPQGHLAKKLDQVALAEREGGQSSGPGLEALFGAEVVARIDAALECFKATGTRYHLS